MAWGSPRDGVECELRMILVSRKEEIGVRDQEYLSSYS